jgi:hypothetical protein
MSKSLKLSWKLKRPSKKVCLNIGIGIFRATKMFAVMKINYQISIAMRKEMLLLLSRF